MMNDDSMHVMDENIDVTYDSFLFPCYDFTIDMPCFECFHFSPIVNSNMMTNCSLPMFVENHDHTFRTLCNKCLTYSPIIASKMLNNCSFKCLVCNNAEILSNEISLIAFSNFGIFPVPMLRIFHPSLCMLPIHILHT